VVGDPNFDVGFLKQEWVMVIQTNGITTLPEYLQVPRTGRGRTLTNEEADAILASPAGQHVQQMVTYSAVGTPEDVGEYIGAFAKHADADELMVVQQSPTTSARLRSVELLADSVAHASAV